MEMSQEVAFVKATGPKKYAPRKPKPPSAPSKLDGAACSCPVVVLEVTRFGGGVSVRAQWPLHAAQTSAAWLREVLA